MTALQQLDVVITRPGPQAAKWQQQLQAAGARTRLLPVLDIIPVSGPVEVQAVKDRILALAEYRKVIFVSQNAVQQALDWIDRYWPQLPVGIQYFAVGSATAALAEQWGLEVEAADRAMNSEALLQLPGLKTVKHEKVLICRGVGGRTYLAEQLRQRGAQVDYCELYHRRLPDDAAKRLEKMAGVLESARRAGRTVVFAVHSGESLENLHRVMIETGCDHLMEVDLLVPGDRVAELAGRLGFQRVGVAANATDEAMTQALIDGL